MSSECKISSDNINNILFHLLYFISKQIKLVLMFFLSELFHLLSLFIPFLYNLYQVRFVQVINNRECQRFFFYYFFYIYCIRSLSPKPLIVYIIVFYNQNPYLGPNMTREKKKKTISRPQSTYLSAVSCNRDCNASFGFDSESVL